MGSFMVKKIVDELWKNLQKILEIFQERVEKMVERTKMDFKIIYEIF